MVTVCEIWSACRRCSGRQRNDLVRKITAVCFPLQVNGDKGAGEHKENLVGSFREFNVIILHRLLQS